MALVSIWLTAMNHNNLPVSMNIEASACTNIGGGNGNNEVCMTFVDKCLCHMAFGYMFCGMICSLFQFSGAMTTSCRRPMMLGFNKCGCVFFWTVPSLN
jgi:hypothetical protein